MEPELNTVYMVHLHCVLVRATYNLVNSDRAVLKLISDCKDCKVQPCKARKVYRDLRETLTIDMNRKAYLAAKFYDKPYQSFYDLRSLEEYDRFFGYTS